MLAAVWLSLLFSWMGVTILGIVGYFSRSVAGYFYMTPLSTALPLMMSVLLLLVSIVLFNHRETCLLEAAGEVGELG
jgi:hypothetical protein